jgi:NADH-quinone oxidoreductase subunit L
VQLPVDRFLLLKKSASDAGKKAFIVNRIGDFGFMLGMFLLFRTFGTLDSCRCSRRPRRCGGPDGQYGTLTIACLLLFMVPPASPRSFLFMSGCPTPWKAHAGQRFNPRGHHGHCGRLRLCALARFIHALAVGDADPSRSLAAPPRCSLPPIGLVQTDIKRVLAYSTVSQLGYMFLAVGVGAFSASIFHLMTHAFFKALLFLAAGSVIHAVGGEQDMRHMGGLGKMIRKTYATIAHRHHRDCRLPPLAAFFSKDSILLSAYQGENGGHILYALGLLTALLTSFYMFRLIFLTFSGKPRFDEHHVHVHESPNSMIVPLMILAVLSIVGGWLAAPAFWGGTDYFTKFLAPVFSSGAEAAGAAEAGEAALMRWKCLWQSSR